MHVSKVISMEKFQEIIGYIETHSVEGISECFAKGVNPNDYFGGEPLIYELTSEYAYAMMGLLPQMHKDDKTITKIVTMLLSRAYVIEYSAQNVPCAYLKK